MRTFLAGTILMMLVLEGCMSAPTGSMAAGTGSNATSAKQGTMLGDTGIKVSGAMESGGSVSIR